MLSYILGVAALSADPAGAGSTAGRIDVGGYVPATCRARETGASAFDPVGGAASLGRLCTGAASVAVSEEDTGGDTRLIRIVVSPL
jgi:hypothetical protein